MGSGRYLTLADVQDGDCRSEGAHMPDKSRNTETEHAESGAEITPEEIQSAHPTEPAEGAREPGEDAGDLRPPHPSDPAEGER